MSINPFDDYRITSPYGWRMHPVYKERKFHTGIDLVKRHKDPIYAFTAGTVKFAGEGKDGTGLGKLGNVVAVQDSAGHMHIYAHLDSVVVKAGAVVERGQMIGRQGNTGVSTGSHLHYEVRIKATPQYGYVADGEKRCFEPTQYLQKFYEKLEMSKIKTMKIVAEDKKGKSALKDGKVNDGVTWVRLRDVAEAFGAKVGFIKGQGATVDGTVVAGRIEDGETWVPIRLVAQLVGAKIVLDTVKSTVTLIK